MINKTFLNKTFKLTQDLKQQKPLYQNVNLNKLFSIRDVAPSLGMKAIIEAHDVIRKARYKYIPTELLLKEENFQELYNITNKSLTIEEKYLIFEKGFIEDKNFNNFSNLF